MSSTLIFRDRALGSIAFYSPVYWDKAREILSFYSMWRNKILAAENRDKLSLHLPVA
jgi:hypothetical protein